MVEQTNIGDEDHRVEYFRYLTDLNGTRSDLVHG